MVLRRVTKMFSNGKFKISGLKPPDSSSQASYRLRRAFYKSSSFAHSAAPRFSPGKRFAGLPDEEVGCDAKTSRLKPPDKRRTTCFAGRPSFGASLLRRLILRGNLKAGGNRRRAASGGRSEPVSRKRRDLRRLKAANRNAATVFTRLRFPPQTSPSSRAAEDIASFLLVPFRFASQTVRLRRRLV